MKVGTDMKKFFKVLKIFTHLKYKEMTDNGFLPFLYNAFLVWILFYGMTWGLYLMETGFDWHWQYKTYEIIVDYTNTTDFVRTAPTSIVDNINGVFSDTVSWWGKGLVHLLVIPTVSLLIISVYATPLIILIVVSLLLYVSCMMFSGVVLFFKWICSNIKLAVSIVEMEQPERWSWVDEQNSRIDK